MLVVLGIVLDLAMDIILFVVEYIVVIGNTLQQVDRFLAVIPGRLRELDAACRSKGCNLVLHFPDAMVDEHRTHRES